VLRSSEESVPTAWPYLRVTTRCWADTICDRAQRSTKLAASSTLKSEVTITNDNLNGTGPTASGSSNTRLMDRPRAARSMKRALRQDHEPYSDWLCNDARRLNAKTRRLPAGFSSIRIGSD